jgi:hypothetical protein
MYFLPIFAAAFFENFRGTPGGLWRGVASTSYAKAGKNAQVRSTPVIPIDLWRDGF